jgi:RHS repeat-associated protein
MKAVNPSGTQCSAGGQCIVYDALGRAVEIDSFGSATEIWYTQLGKTAYMTGSTFNYAYFPAPGGGTYLRTGLGANATFNFMHKDNLGNARITSSITEEYVVSDRAYAPYGEIYNIFDSTEQNQNMFTGSTQDILSGMYDTPNRELQGSQQGRWLSPDPAGAGWNQYAYATNPNSSIDPSGLTPFPYFPNNAPTADEFDQMALYSNAVEYPGQALEGFSALAFGPTAPSGTVGADYGTITGASGGSFGGFDGLDPAPNPQDVPDAPIDPAYQALIPPGCTADSCPVAVTAAPPPDIVLFAAPFYPGMNGTYQAIQQAAKGYPSTSPRPTLSPGNKPAPQFPEDFQSEWTKLLAAWFEAMQDVLTDTIVVPMTSPCILEPKLGCGPAAPPEL